MVLHWEKQEAISIPRRNLRPRPLGYSPGRTTPACTSVRLYGGGANTRNYDAIYTREIDEAIFTSRGVDRHHFDRRAGGSNKAKDALLFFNAAIPCARMPSSMLSAGSVTAIRNLPPYTDYRDGPSATIHFFIPTVSCLKCKILLRTNHLPSASRERSGNWDIDISNVYGKNDFGNVITNSLNASLGLKSPTTFDAGSYNASQNTGSIDISRYFTKALKGINVAFGAQYRVETYRIIAGEEASYSKGDLRTIYGLDTTATGIIYNVKEGSIGLNGLSPGSQIHAGFRPENAVNVSRSILAWLCGYRSQHHFPLAALGALRLEKLLPARQCDYLQNRHQIQHYRLAGHSRVA